MGAVIAVVQHQASGWPVAGVSRPEYYPKLASQTPRKLRYLETKDAGLHEMHCPTLRRDNGKDHRFARAFNKSRPTARID
jgi:hypothetical protein